MTFQYFFFATVAGYFLQALPFALAAGVWYALRLHKKEPALPGGQVVLRSLFPCYFAGLLVFNIFLYPVSDLYDLPEETKCSRCIVHPVHKHCSRRSRVSDYCADLCVLLSYYKMQDDWNDEHKLKALLAKALLKPTAKRVASNSPEKAAFIEKKMNMLTIVESARNLPLDKVAKVFGEILAEVFVYQDDYWKDDLYKIGFFLGKYIYLLDAYEDIEDDLKTGAYNPFKELYGGETFDDQVLNLLLLMIGECTDAFERLPLVDNVEILRNILYSGVWVRYGKTKSERAAKSGSGKKDSKTVKDTNPGFERKGEAETADGSL